MACTIFRDWIEAATANSRDTTCGHPAPHTSTATSKASRLAEKIEPISLQSPTR